MKSFKCYLLLLTFLSSGFVASTQVQLGEGYFGKTRIQEKTFKWQFLASDNFEIHYYEGGEKPARLAIQFLESEFPRITELIGSTPYSKTRILLYNSTAELQQSNVGINSQEMNHSGELLNNQSYVQVAFTGQYESFKEELLYKVAKNLVFELLFLGNSTDFFESAYQLSLPEWFMEGIALYVARGWDDQMDDYLRNYAKNGSYKKLNRYTGDEAGKIGQSVWNFIAVRFGPRNISNILNLTRIIRNEERSIEQSIGIRYARFTQEWFNFYQIAASNANETHLSHSSEGRKPITGSAQSAGAIKISPDGAYAAYNTYQDGRYQLVLWDLASNNTSILYQGGRKVFNQEFESRLPVFDWMGNDQMLLVDRRKAEFDLIQLNLNGRVIERVPLPQFTHVTDMNVAPDGRRVAFSATVNGQNDLFVYIPSNNFLRRLTNDLFDVNHPQFLVGSNSIAFSSNRTNDSLQVRIQSLAEVSKTFSIYTYDLDTTDGVLGRITSTVSRDFHPQSQGPNRILFTSDQRGIQNLYAFDTENRNVVQVTGFNSGLISYDYSARSNRLVYLTFSNGRLTPHWITTALSETFFPNMTVRQQTKQALMVAERRNAAASGVSDALDPELIDNRREATELLLSQAKEGEILIDTENYVFDIEEEDRAPSRRPADGAILSTIRDRSGAGSRILGPFPFDSRFAVDHVQTDARVDPLRGFGIMPKVRLSDVLEDHTFTGALFFPLDFSSGSEILARYDLRKFKPDFSFQYLRRTFNQSTSDIQHKYTLDQVEMMISYPINSFAQFRAGPLLAQTRYFDQDPRLLTPNLPPGLPPLESSNQYFGGKAELVFDNSSILDANISKGTMAKAAISYFEHSANANHSFGKIRVDARHFQPLSRNIILAARLNYGRFFGPSAQQFMLGGSENWLFNRTRQGEGERLNNPLVFSPFVDNSNILFHEFVPTVRGFDFNFFNGTDFLSFNAEIRLPLLSYLHRGPIASNFLRNFQLIGFYDIGSAWSDGRSPFTEQSSQNIELVRPPGSPFSAVINNFGNPWLQSVGLGARTVLMGYFVRFDLAYPIEAYRTPSSRFLVSLGYDF